MEFADGKTSVLYKSSDITLSVKLKVITICKIPERDMCFSTFPYVAKQSVWFH